MSAGSYWKLLRLKESWVPTDPAEWTFILVEADRQQPWERAAKENGCMRQRVTNGIFRYELWFEPAINSMYKLVLGLWCECFHLSGPSSTNHFLILEAYNLQKFFGNSVLQLLKQRLIFLRYLVAQGRQFMTSIYDSGMLTHHRMIHSDYNIHFRRSLLSCGLF